MITNMSLPRTRAVSTGLSTTVTAAGAGGGDALSERREASRKLLPVSEQHSTTEGERPRRTRVTGLVGVDVEELTGITGEVYTHTSHTHTHTRTHVSLRTVDVLGNL